MAWAVVQTSPPHGPGGSRERTGRGTARRRRRLRRAQLSDEVAGHLRAAIMSGTLRPGTFIRLDETAGTARRQHHAGARGPAEAARRGHGAARAASRSRRAAVEPPGHRRHLLAAGHHRQGVGRPTAAEHHRRRDRRARPTSTTRWPAAVAARRSGSHRRRRVRVPPRVQPAGRPDQAGLVPAARRALHAAADLRHRSGLGRRRGREPPPADRRAAAPRHADAVVELTAWQFTDGARRLTEKLEQVRDLGPERSLSRGQAARRAS